MADVKISALPAVVTPTLADLLLETVQGGVNKKITGTQLRQATFNDSDYDSLLVQADPGKGYWFSDHFELANVTTRWLSIQSGGAESFAVAQIPSGLFIGEVRSKLSTAGGYYTHTALYNKFKTGQGKTTIKGRLYQAVVAGGEAAKFVYGLGDTSIAADADQVNGVYLEYDNGQSANWRYCTSSTSTRTKTNSSVAVTAGIHTWRIEINSDWTSVEFFVDGVSLGVITTNIPSAVNNLSLIAHAYKRTGNGQLTLYHDIYDLYCLYSTPLVF